MPVRRGTSVPRFATADPLRRYAFFADQLPWRLVEADDRTQRIGWLSVEVQYVFHPGHVLGVNDRNAPHLLLPWLEWQLGQPASHRIAGHGLVRGEAHHLASEQVQGPLGAPVGWLRTCH